MMATITSENIAVVDMASAANAADIGLEPPRLLTPVTEEQTGSKGDDDEGAGNNDDVKRSVKTRGNIKHTNKPFIDIKGHQQQISNFGANDGIQRSRPIPIGGCGNNFNRAPGNRTAPVGASRWTFTERSSFFAKSLEDEGDRPMPLRKQQGHRHRSVTTTLSNQFHGRPHIFQPHQQQLFRQHHQFNQNSMFNKRSSNTSSGINSAGVEGSFDHYDDSFDEPFSDTDDEGAQRRVSYVKPQLPIPRGRIRTLSGTVPPIGYSPKFGGPTMCLCCLRFFNLPDMIESFSSHLLTDHNIVITDIDLIVDLKRYVEHWRQRLGKGQEVVEKILPKVEPNENDPVFGQVKFYYRLSDALQEDWDLRQQLAMRRLQEVLLCQQREREETTFLAECLFCKYLARGNRAKLVHHLFHIHRLNLGSPENLVFVLEYIEYLRDKIQNNVCIYCEQTFQDRTTLMDHMRRRGHREVNPKNSHYDRFYVINYLELGKRWLEVIAEDFEDTMPTFMDSDDEDESLAWQEWQLGEEADDGQGHPLALCLFCSTTAEDMGELLEHIKTSHDFDLLETVEREGLDTYARLKLINYFRKDSYKRPPLKSASSNATDCAQSKTGESEGNNSNNTSPPNKAIVSLPDRECWDKEENLAPFFGNDHFPWMFESYMLAREESELIEDSREKKTDEETFQEPKTPADPIEEEKRVFQAMFKESKASMVSEVVPEDPLDLLESVLADKELRDSLH